MTSSSTMIIHNLGCYHAYGWNNLIKLWRVIKTLSTIAHPFPVILVFCVNTIYFPSYQGILARTSATPFPNWRSWPYVSINFKKILAEHYFKLKLNDHTNENWHYESNNYVDVSTVFQTNVGASQQSVHLACEMTNIDKIWKYTYI